MKWFNNGHDGMYRWYKNKYYIDLLEFKLHYSVTVRSNKRRFI